MDQIVQICGCIRVLFGWFCCRKMFFVFHGVFGDGLEGGCVLVLGCFQCHHIIIVLFRDGSCR
jgi:hypothetical protein